MTNNPCPSSTGPALGGRMEPPANHPETFDELTASGPVRLSWINHADPSAVSLVEGFSGLSLVRIELPQEPQVWASANNNFVPTATTDDPAQSQQNKACELSAEDAGQCAGTTHPNTPTQAPPPLSSSSTPKASAQKAKRGNKSGRAAPEIAWGTAQPSVAILTTPPTRKARRAAAELGKLILKPWRNLSSAEKAAAAVWQVAKAAGEAFTLNLGIGREGSLLNHENPRRLFQKHLSRHLSAAGLGDVPYVMTFEVTSEDSNGFSRLHLHGAIETAHLTPAERERLQDALCKAAQVASGAIGGERQLDMRPIHGPAGWIDYMLEDQARTRRDLSLDDLWLISNTMRSRAEKSFKIMRDERTAA